MEAITSIFLLIFLVGLFIAIYLLPSFVAAQRHHPNRVAIFVLNIFLGWTAIGWVGALVWAYTVTAPERHNAAA